MDLNVFAFEFSYIFACLATMLKLCFCFKKLLFVFNILDMTCQTIDLTELKFLWPVSMTNNSQNIIFSPDYSVKT